MAILFFQSVLNAVRPKPRTNEMRTQLEKLRDRTQRIFGSNALMQARAALTSDVKYLEGVRVAVERDGIAAYSHAKSDIELEHATGVQQLHGHLKFILGEISKDSSRLSEKQLFVILNTLGTGLETLEHTILDLQISHLRGVSEQVSSALIMVMNVMVMDTWKRIGNIKDVIRNKTGIELSGRTIID